MKAFITQKAIDSIKKTTRGQNQLTEIEKLTLQGLEAYIADKHSWAHNFADPSNGNCLESRQYAAKGEGTEASILSKSVFYCLLIIMKKHGLIDYSIPAEHLDINIFQDRSAAYCGGSLFYFDVMNNSNAVKENGDLESYSRIGTMALIMNAPLTFSLRRYMIGNFAPIPWWIENSRNGCNLQLLHNDLSEWWDMLLLYLQWRMDEFAGASMSFVDYIIFTCQFFYIENFSKMGSDRELFADLFAGNITANTFCNRIGKKRRKDETPWTEHVIKWSKQMKGWSKNKELRILSLMDPPLGSDEKTLDSDGPRALEPIDPATKRTGEGFKEEYWHQDGKCLRDIEKFTPKQIRKTDKLISRLIEVRGRCIMELLRENIDVLGF